MRVSFQGVQNRSLGELGSWWALCDRLGATSVGIADSPAQARDAFVTAGAMLGQTQELSALISVSNPITRDVSTMASAAATVAELGPGRFVLGLGTGDSALWSVGLKRAKVETLREYIVALKALWAGEKATYLGRPIEHTWVPEGVADIPVYVACSGPRVLEMAAQVADGVIVAMGFAEENIAYVEEIIARGCGAAGRDPSTLDVWWNSSVVFGESREAAMERHIGGTAAWLTAATLEGKQIPDEIKPKLVEFTADSHDLKAVYQTPGRQAELVRRAKGLGIYDWLIARAPGMWGTPAEIAAALDRHLARGLLNWSFYLGGHDIDRDRSVVMFMEEVLPLVTADRSSGPNQAAARV